ncbi:MAG: cupin-like domain-containing protein [Proteobacteria bacterium]|nr:cupin-like domain-containing protein [Pseudomonadota bacterium]
MMELDVVSHLSEQAFIENFIAENRPVVVKNDAFDADKWTPEFMADFLDDLPVQVYDSLFDLQEVTTLANYIGRHFSQKGEYRDKVPYVRWYNKLKEVDYIWSDEAFGRMSPYWSKPSFLPERSMIIPSTNRGVAVDPVTDSFPYRGILVAARGARTRLHTDPFCSDAVVAQFYGVKEIVMYEPDRFDEMRHSSNENIDSFAGFIDVRQPDLNQLTHEPDYHGFIGPGDVVYVPHGWMHDVLVVEDSISTTWNFVHEQGSLAFIDYLMDGPEEDSEFEVLKYFYSLAGDNFHSARDILAKYNEYFLEIEPSST